MVKNQNYEGDTKDHVLTFRSDHSGWWGSPPSSLLFIILPELRQYAATRRTSPAGSKAQCLSNREQHPKEEFARQISFIHSQALQFSLNENTKWIISRVLTVHPCQVLLRCYLRLQLSNLLYVGFFFFFFFSVLLMYNAVTEHAKWTYPFPVGTNF